MKALEDKVKQSLTDGHGYANEYVLEEIIAHVNERVDHAIEATVKELQNEAHSGNEPGFVELIKTQLP